MNYYRTVTFQPPTETLTNFPVLVRIRNDRMGSRILSPKGWDVCFELDGNRLPFELDWYDANSGSGAWWVQIPTLSSSAPTSIKMLYGDASITSDQSDPAAVFAGYDYVYHFTDPDNMKSSVGSYTAVESGNISFTSISAVSNSLTGLGLKFNQTTGYGDSYAALRIANAVNTSTATFSAFFSNTKVLASDRQFQAQTGWTNYGFKAAGTNRITYAGGKTNTVSASQDSIFTYGASTKSGTVAWVQNGTVLDTSSASAGYFRWDNPFISATGYSSSKPTSFVLDELRLSSTTFRSESWLEYEQLNLAQHDSYTSYGPEFNADGTPVTSFVPWIYGSMMLD